MKKYLLSLTVLAAFASMSFAQQPQAPATQPAAETPKAEAPKAAAKPAKAAAKKAVAKPEIVTGDITAIDPASNVITVKDEKGVEKPLTIDAKKLATLKVGDHIRVTLKEGKVLQVKAIKKPAPKKAEPAKK